LLAGVQLGGSAFYEVNLDRSLILPQSRFIAAKITGLGSGQDTLSFNVMPHWYFNLAPESICVMAAFTDPVVK
jgi:hypothetical protein